MNAEAIKGIGEILLREMNYSNDYNGLARLIYSENKITNIYNYYPSTIKNDIISPYIP